MTDYINQQPEKKILSIEVDSDGNGTVTTIVSVIDPVYEPLEFSLEDNDPNLSIDPSTGVVTAAEYIYVGDTQTATVVVNPDGFTTPKTGLLLSVVGTKEGGPDPEYTFRSRIDFTDTSLLYQNTDFTSPVTTDGQRIGSAIASGGSMNIVARDVAKKPEYVSEGGQNVARFDYHGDVSMMTWDVTDGTDLSNTTIIFAINTPDDVFIPIQSYGGEQEPLLTVDSESNTSALGVGPIEVNNFEYTSLTQQAAVGVVSTSTWKFVVARNKDFSATEAGSNAFTIGNYYNGGGKYALVPGDIVGLVIITDANDAAITDELNWLKGLVVDFPGFELANGQYGIPSVSNGYTYQADFSYAGEGTPGTLKALLVDFATDDPLSDEITFNYTDDSISIPYDSETLEGTTGVGVKIYEASNPSHTDTLPIADIPYLYPVARTEEGKSLSVPSHQTADVGQSGVADFYTNRADLLQWWAARAPFGGGDYLDISRDGNYMTVDGVPNGTLPSGYTHWMAMVWQDGYVGYGRGGVYDIDWTTTGVELQWGIFDGATAGSINNTTKSASITVSENSNVGRAEMRFLKTGSVTNWGLTIIQSGETSTGPINSVAEADFAASPAMRFMKMSGAESPTPEIPAQFPYKMFNPKGSPTMIGGIAAQTGLSPWISMVPNEDDDFTTEFATRLKTTMPPGIPIYVELFNEPWNIRYDTGRHVIQIRALDGGFVDGVSAGSYNWVLTPNYTIATIPSGTYFMTDGWGTEIACLALNDVPPGTAIGTTTTSLYQVLATPDEVHTGMFDFLAYRVGQIKDIFETVFDGDNEIKAVFGIQLGAGEWAYYNIAAQMMRGGTGTEYGKKIDLISPSHYYSEGLITSWNGTTGPQSPAYVLGYADQTAFNEGLYADSLTAIDIMIDGTNWLGSQMKYWGVMREAGWSASDIPRFGTYEGGSHFLVADVPGGDINGLAAATQAFKYSTYYYDAQKYMLERLDDLGMEMYTNFGIYGSVSNYSGIVAIFGWLTYVGAFDDPDQVANEKSWEALLDFYEERA